MNAPTHERLFFEGVACMKAGAGPRAEAYFREALELQPEFAEAHANLAWMLECRGAAGEAERHYRCALALAPGNAQTHTNFGRLLLAQKRFDEAELAYRHAVALDPSSPAHWSNLGVLCACMKRETDAEQCYRTALTLDPTHPSAQFNLSYVLLRQGRFEEGWLRFEARAWYAATSQRLPCPRWHGEALAAKSILITDEAGHGDMIQFVRYTPQLRARGAAHITLLCHPALKTLFGTLRDVDRVVGFDEELPGTGFDYWVPLLSLPYHFETRLESIPAQLPYLFAQPSRVRAWAARLPRNALRVGLNWRGNPRFENDADRSIPHLELLAPLAGLPDVTFISLQRDVVAAKQVAGLTLFDAASHIEDFSDTAAIIANLDLTISVDTAVAHLTGALAKPCWLLLPDYKADPRWLSERTDSVWYPRVMRLFRQQRQGDWSGVILEVRAALERFPRSSTRIE